MLQVGRLGLLGYVFVYDGECSVHEVPKTVEMVFTNEYVNLKLCQCGGVRANLNQSRHVCWLVTLSSRRQQQNRSEIQNSTTDKTDRQTKHGKAFQPTQHATDYGLT